MAAIPFFEVTFGDVSNLPGASILENFIPHNKFLIKSEVSAHIFALPEYPEAIIRLQPSTASEHDALIAPKHFAVMQDSGLTVPAQRIVYGNSRPQSSLPFSLYAITELIEGDTLCEQSQPEYNRVAIDGIARYWTWALSSEQTGRYFFDMGAEQFTVLRDGAGVAWHDTGLNVCSRNDHTLGVGYGTYKLSSWSKQAKLPESDSVREFKRVSGLLTTK
jgi:hypothetical protein